MRLRIEEVDALHVAKDTSNTFLLPYLLVLFLEIFKRDCVFYLIESGYGRLHTLGDGLGLVLANTKGLGHATEGILDFAWIAS